MIPAKRSIIDFNRKFDRHVSEDKRGIRIEDKLACINEAQEVYMENIAAVAEYNTEVRNSLRVLEEKEIELTLLEKKPTYNIYKIPEDSYKILRQRVIASKKDCGVKEIPVIIFQTDDLNNARKNPFWKSSYEWEHALADEGSKGLYVWHEGDFDIDSLIIDYYRKPKEIKAASMTEFNSYEDRNGVVVTKDQGCELSDTYSHRKIIDIAVLIARANMGDIRDFDLKLNEIFNKEKLNN